jgi:hypothetical protein
MNFMIHGEWGRLKTCRILSVLFYKSDVIDGLKNGHQIISIHKHEPNNQSSSRQHVIPDPFRNFSLG